MKKIVLLLAFVFSAIFSEAQLAYQWANSAGSAANSEYGQAIASDPSGNVYITGAFFGTVDFDPSAATANLTSLSGSKDVFLAKYNSAGAFIWVKQIAGTNDEKPYDLVADASGAYLAGNFLGTVDFDPNAGTNNITFLGGGTDGDGFFAKYDVNGNLSWVDRIGSTVNDRVTSIAIDASANVYVTGFIGGNADMDPSASSASLNVSGTYNAYIGKYSSAGAYILAKQITGGYSEGDDINVDASGNIYLTGSYATTNDFDPSAATANLSTSSLTQLDIFLAKYTNAGVYTFAKQIGGTGVDIGYQVVPDASGNIYLGGVFSSTCDFDPTATVNSLTSAGQGDLFVAKYDASGNLTWKTGTGGTTNDYCFGLGLDGSNNVYITGKVQGTNIDFDPSASSSLLTSASSCMYIASYSSAGSFLSLSSPSIASIGNGLCVNSSLYVAGTFAGTGDFDFSASTSNLTSLGSDDVFFAKYNACAGSPPAQPSAITGNFTVCSGTAQTYSVVNDPLATSYTWSFPVGWTGSSSTNVSVPTVGVGGIISVVATNSCGASLAQTVNVTVNPLPVATASNNSPVCVGGMISFTAASGGAGYTWTGPNSFIAIPQIIFISNAQLNNAGIYTLSVISALNCTNTTTINLVVNPLPIITTVTNQTVCLNSPINLTANGGVAYSWSGPVSFNSTLQNPVILNASVNMSGIYTVVVTSSAGCTNSATSSVSVLPLPIPSITSNSPCQGSVLNLNGSPAGASYNWSGPNGFTSILQNPNITSLTFAASGTYTLITSVGSCSALVTHSVLVLSSPTLTAISNASIICAGETATLTANGASTYSWNTTATNSSITVSPTTNTTYTVTGTSSNGCFASASITQSVSLCTGINANENKNAFVNIYPNPFSSEIVVALNSINENTELTIYNSTAQLVHRASINNNKNIIHLNWLPAGIYFVKTANSGDEKIIKLIKN
jgi:hypothetical protein